MYYRFSNWTKVAILINVFLTLSIGLYHVHSIYQIQQTSQKIHQVIDQQHVSRQEAIKLLQARAENLFLGDEFFAFFGAVSAIATLIALYYFAVHNTALSLFLTIVLAFLTSFLGGILLAFVVLTGRLETITPSRYFVKTEQHVAIEWQDYIKKRSQQ